MKDMKFTKHDKKQACYATRYSQNRLHEDNTENR